MQIHLRHFAALCAAAACCTVGAADLRVAPVLVEPPAGARAGTITLSNGEQRPLRAQIRVMRWSMENGTEALQPTSDVVASPQITLAPGQEYVVRVVRVGAARVAGEESYRVVVDEVPDPAAARPGTVDLVLRQSIPVFFSDQPQRTARVDWKLVREDGQLWLAAHNTGSRRLRVADLALSSAGQPVFSQLGLVGYVLAGAQTRWPINAAAGAIAPNASLTLKAMADTGEMEVTVDAPPGQ